MMKLPWLKVCSVALMLVISAGLRSDHVHFVHAGSKMKIVIALMAAS